MKFLNAMGDEMRNCKKTISFILILTIIACFVSTFFTGCTQDSTTVMATPDGTFALHAIDVGQGDSFLLESQGEYMLIDAGERSEGSRVVSYLRSHGAEKLKYCLITHAHSDHSGGMSGVINAIEIDNMIMQMTDYSSEVWEYVCEKTLEKQIPVLEPKVGDSYTLGEGVFTIVAPGSDLYSDLNNTSICISVQFGQTSFLLTGDSEKISEEEMLRSGQNLKADVLKVGHHGSSSSTSEEFLNAVSPKYALLSVGKDNQYNLPSEKVMKRLADIPVYRTDVSGNIIVTSDGKNISFSTAPASGGETKETVNNDIGGTEEEPTENTTGSSQAKNTDEGRPNTVMPEEVLFVANKNSKKYHLKTCSSVNKIKSENLIYIYSYEEITQGGYEACKSCKPK